MKKIYALIVLAVSLKGSGQSFSVMNKDANNATVSDNASLYFSTTAYGTLEHHFLVKNLGASSTSISVRRYDDLINKVSSTDSSIAYFCTGITCYDPSVSTAGMPLGSNGTSTDTLGFKSYFTEASVRGESAIRYKFTNSANNESLSFTFRYNNINGVRETSASVFGMYPNPCQSELHIISSPGDHITIMNTLGEIVVNTGISAYTTVVSTAALAPGMYSVIVRSATGTSSERLLITK